MLKRENREISSGIIIFRKTPDGPRFLALYYGRNSWTFPRGKIEIEEKSFEAALRETKEETGFSKQDLELLSRFKAYENWTYVKNGRKIFKTVIFYMAETYKKHARIEDRSQGYGWFTYSEALRIFSGPKNVENRKVLKKAYCFINPSFECPSKKRLEKSQNNKVSSN